MIIRKERYIHIRTSGQVLYRDLLVSIERVVLARVGITKGQVVNGVRHVEL
jgi:fructose-1,6-bisphosphatase/sedoheptulose 1,7-bisphosphatase-like protein